MSADTTKTFDASYDDLARGEMHRQIDHLADKIAALSAQIRDLHAQVDAVGTDQFPTYGDVVSRVYREVSNSLPALRLEVLISTAATIDVNRASGK